MPAMERAVEGYEVTRGGRIPGTLEPAFSLATARGDPGLPILVAAPHGGRAYPPGLLATMRDPAPTMPRLEDRAIDWIAREAAAACGASLLVAHAPRALIDLNRAPEDFDWTMLAPVPGAPPRAPNALNRRARAGLGLVPRRMAGVGEIWNAPLPADALDARLTGIHTPYHAALSACLAWMRDRWGAALLIDLHSMPPLGDEPTAARTGFVLGDRFGSACDPEIAALALSLLHEGGRGVAHNRPYAGGYVLDRHGRPMNEAHAIQLEVCRSLYLDPGLEALSSRARGVAHALGRVFRRLGEAMLDRGASRALPVAAE